MITEICFPHRVDKGFHYVWSREHDFYHVRYVPGYEPLNPEMQSTSEKPDAPKTAEYVQCRFCGYEKQVPRQ